MKPRTLPRMKSKPSLPVQEKERKLSLRATFTRLTRLILTHRATGFRTSLIRSSIMKFMRTSGWRKGRGRSWRIWRMNCCKELSFIYFSKKIVKKFIFPPVQPNTLSKLFLLLVYAILQGTSQQDTWHAHKTCAGWEITKIIK